jgi:hypothetical protein
MTRRAQTGRIGRTRISIRVTVRALPDVAKLGVSDRWRKIVISLIDPDPANSQSVYAPVLDSQDCLLHVDANVMLRLCSLKSQWLGRVNEGIGNGQACLGENAFNDLFSAIVVQRVQRIAPARELATQELGLAPNGVFLVLDVEAL